MKASVEASTASVQASIACMKASIASTKDFMEVVKDSMKTSMEDMKASMEEKTRTFPRIRKLPRKHFHGCLGFISMEASSSFQGRSNAQSLPPQLPRKLFMKAFKVASKKSWKLHQGDLTFYFRGRFRSLHRISAASTTAATDILALYTTVLLVEVTNFSTTWFTNTVYETKGVSPYIGCRVSWGTG